MLTKAEFWVFFSFLRPAFGPGSILLFSSSPLYLTQNIELKRVLLHPRPVDSGAVSEGGGHVERTFQPQPTRLLLLCVDRQQPGGQARQEGQGQWLVSLATLVPIHPLSTANIFLSLFCRFSSMYHHRHTPQTTITTSHMPHKTISGNFQLAQSEQVGLS